MTPGYLMICIAGAVAHPGTSGKSIADVVMYVIPCVCAVPLNLRRARQYQRRIEELDMVERAV
jgi:hypothetical protein